MEEAIAARVEEETSNKVAIKDKQATEEDADATKANADLSSRFFLPSSVFFFFFRFFFDPLLSIQPHNRLLSHPNNVLLIAKNKQNIKTNKLKSFERTTLSLLLLSLLASRTRPSVDCDELFEANVAEEICERKRGLSKQWS